MISYIRRPMALLLIALLLIAGAAVAAVVLTTPGHAHRATTCVTIDGGLEPGLNCSIPNPDQAAPAAQPATGCWLVDPSEPQWGYNCAGTSQPPWTGGPVH